MTLRFPISLLLAAAHVAAFSSPPVHYSNAAASLSLSSKSTSTTLRHSLQSLDDTNMKDLLFQPPKGKAVLVDACAPWCGPCKLIEPYLDEAAKKHSDQLSILKYDVEGDNNKNLKVEMLLQGVMVRGLPTLVLYNDNGEPLATHSGAITQNGLEEWLEDNLFSKMEEFDAEVEKQQQQQSMSTTTPTVELNKKQKERGRVDEDGDIGEKRGFVSFTSQGPDDYMLSAN